MFSFATPQHEIPQKILHLPDGRIEYDENFIPATRQKQNWPKFLCLPDGRILVDRKICTCRAAA